MAIHILNETQDIHLAFTKDRLNMMTRKEKLYIRNSIMSNKSVNSAIKVAFEELYNSSTRDASDIIEIPKGRSNNNEVNIYTAIREFTEETKIREEDIEIVKFMNPYVYIIRDENIIYILKVYCATYIGVGDIPVITAEDKLQLREVIETKWYSARDIKSIIVGAKIDSNYEKYVGDGYINYNYENLVFVERIMNAFDSQREAIKSKQYNMINTDTFNHISRFNLHSNHSREILARITDYKEKLAHRRRPKIYNNFMSGGFDNKSRRSKATNAPAVTYENRPNNTHIIMSNISVPKGVENVESGVGCDIYQSIKSKGSRVKHHSMLNSLTISCMNDDINYDNIR